MSRKYTSEAAFETVIESHLLANGYTRIAEVGFDQARAIFPETVLGFIRETQPKEWAKLEALHGAKTGEQIITDLCKWMDANGSLATLRHGFKCYGRTLRVAFFKAAHGLNPELETRYAANRVGITRQLHFSERDRKSLDVTVSLNGIPVLTVELKNALTGQTVDDAIKQYKTTRRKKPPCFASEPGRSAAAYLFRISKLADESQKPSLVPICRCTCDSRSSRSHILGHELREKFWMDHGRHPLKSLYDTRHGTVGK